jgi:hypothetical protein
VLLRKSHFMANCRESASKQAGYLTGRAIPVLMPPPAVVGGGTIAISVDINQFLFDYFFGGYVSLQPVKWFRLYVGAGPLLIYGSWETDEKDPTTSQVETKSESGFSAGVYGRGGIDIIISENFILGAGIRGTKTGLSFNDTVGNVDVEGWQYFGVISFRF